MKKEIKRRLQICARFNRLVVKKKLLPLSAHAYCITCTGRHEIKSPQLGVLPKGDLIVKGYCPRCQTDIWGPISMENLNRLDTFLNAGGEGVNVETSGSGIQSLTVKFIRSHANEFAKWLQDNPSHLSREFVDTPTPTLINWYRQAVAKVLSDLVRSNRINLKNLRDGFTAAHLKSLREAYFSLRDKKFLDNKTDQVYSKAFNAFVSFTVYKTTPVSLTASNISKSAVRNSGTTSVPKAPKAPAHTPRRVPAKTLPKPMSTHQYLRDSVDNSTVLTMTYTSRSGEMTRDIEILAYGPLYFDAYDHLRGEVRTFRTDRVSNIKPNSLISCKPRQYSPSKFVESNVIGRSTNAISPKPARAKLTASPTKNPTREQSLATQPKSRKPLKPARAKMPPFTLTKKSTKEPPSSTQPKSIKPLSPKPKRGAIPAAKSPGIGRHPNSIKKIIVYLDSELPDRAPMMEYQHQQDGVLRLTVNKNNPLFPISKDQDAKETYVKNSCLDALVEINQRASSSNILPNTATELRNQFALHLEKYEYEYHGSWT